MTDETNAGSVSAGESAAIAAAVEDALSTERGGTVQDPAAKLAQARNIYLTWRNANLGNLSQASFEQVEAASPLLIADIAAAL